MITNRVAQLIYRAIFVALSLIGIMQGAGFFYGGTPNIDNLVFYTNLSNYLCFIVMIIVLIKTYKHVAKGELRGNNDIICHLKFYTTIIILVTFLVYNILLTDNMFGTGFNELGNLLLHIVLPLLFVFDFLLFDKHHSLKWYDPLLSTVLPLIYVAFILIRGAIIKDSYDGVIYPYFFLDVSSIGIGSVFLWVFVLLLIFIVIGYVFYLYDKIYIKDRKIRFSIKKPELEKEPS